MFNLREWTWTRWSVVATILSAVVLIGGTLTAGEKIAGYVPLATKGYVILIVDERVAPIMQSIEAYGQNLDRDRLSSLELRLTVLINTKMSIADSLSKAPGDDNLEKMELEISRDIDDTEGEIRQMKCQMGLIIRC